MNLQRLPSTRQNASKRTSVVRHGVATSVLRTMSNRTASGRKPVSPDVVKAEETVLALLSPAKARGRFLDEEARQQLQEAVDVLEEARGVDAPTTLPALLDGKWRLLYTSRPGTASPIQNLFTGEERFAVFQEILLDTASAASTSGAEEDDARVNNIVEFGSIGYLKVEAQASTDARPLPGFTPRQGEGLPFGIMGRSITTPPERPHMRIDFQFDKAAFYFSFLPFSIPYPVPFRILGDERKGWLDVTYVNREGTFRLSRGNKGTLFVLARERSPKDLLLEAIAEGNDSEVLRLIDDLEEAGTSFAKPARNGPAVTGRWKLMWSQQAENASWLQKWGSRQAESYQIIDASTGELSNVVELGSAGRVVAVAQCSAASDDRTTVDIKSAQLSLGPLKFNLPQPSPENNPGYVDWLYLDADTRITQGSKGSLFIHRRADEGTSFNN